MEFKRIICILAYVLTLLLSDFLYADQTLDERDCTTVDFSKQLGAVRNQGNIGWCYANVAADLLTFRYQDQLQGEQASAGYVAIAFNQWAKAKPNEDAGLITPSVVFSQVYGICPQSFQDTALKDSPYKTIRDQINALVSLKETYELRKKEKLVSFRFQELEIYRTSKSYLNLLSDDDLVEVLEKSSVRTFPRKLAERLCKPYMIKVKFDLNIRPQVGFVEGWKHVIPSLLAKRKFIPSPVLGRADLVQEIHEQLDRDNFVALSYWTRIFYEPGSERYNKAGIHASGIVGRKWNIKDKVCEFKLRNSWGKSCASYTNPELKGKCDPETGYLMIPDTIVMRTITDMSYYKKQKE
jgi:hypothetical protein